MLIGAIMTFGLSSASEELAKETLREAARALRTDRVIVDRMSIEGRLRGVSVREEATVEVHAEGTGRLVRRDVLGLVEGDWIHLTREGDPRYFAAEMGGEIEAVLLGAARLPLRVACHFSLLAAEDDEDRLQAFAVDWDDEVSLRGAARESLGDRSCVRIDLAHAEGDESLWFDATSFALVERRARGGERELRVRHHRSLGPKAEALSFDPGDRPIAADAMEILFPRPGDRAMDFAAEQPDGTRVVLSELLKDGPVVLDFWATWCVPCRGALNEIQEFVASGDASGVRVIAVNVAETLEGEARRERVAEFMREAGYAFPAVIDFDDSIRIAYRASSIPVTVVVGTDGSVKAAHRDLTEDFGDWLREAVR